MRRGIVKRVGRETIRVTLANHELKPWREKNGSSGIAGVADDGELSASR
jgi:hypothetical protein